MERAKLRTLVEERENIIQRMDKVLKTIEESNGELGINLTCMVEYSNLIREFERNAHKSINIKIGLDVV